MEILAPVGGPEQLIAAVRCGADAVYLGAKGFNARQNAENFAETSLQEAVAYCHARGVRVHVTVNTLVTDEELPALMETLREVASSGADAVIVQDLAVARRVRDCCPDIAMHASTQMTIHNAAGAEQMRQLGFSRVVLARELTIDEISILHQKTDIELETFVHGALCMSLSGACYLSSMLGGRSGNRGLCAQPCRLDFKCGARGHALSLKDLSAFAHLDALEAAGVVSLKIEGRMKRPEYVAAAVTACRMALAGEPYDLETLEAAFSRGGFTDGYLTGRRDLSMFGIRDRSDVEASQRVQGRLASLYRKEYPGVPVDMTLTMLPGKAVQLTVTDGVNSTAQHGPLPEVALHAPTDEARARRQMSKTGDSPFFLRSFTLVSKPDLMAPASVLNALRRATLEDLLRIREAPQPKRFVSIPLPAHPAHIAQERPGLHLRFASASQCWDGMQAERIILPLEAIEPRWIDAYGERLVGEVPALVFPDDEDRTRDLLLRCKAHGLSGVLCQNAGAIHMARQAGLAPHGGHGLNILNTLALEEYAGLGVQDAIVSFELSAQRIRRLGGTLPRGAVAYGHLPLMLLRCCPVQSPDGCNGCAGAATLTDRLGLSFPVQCHLRRFSALLNPVPLNLSGEPLAGVDFQMLWFTDETAATCRRTAEAFDRREKPAGGRTRGLYHRTLQ